VLSLALDTSTSKGSVALGADGNVMEEIQLDVRATRSETVLPAVHSLLKQCGRAPSDLSAVVVGGGPGSFTGVRIAASLAKGMCHALDLEMYAYSSLAAVAVGAGASGPICALFDARRGQVYAGGYRIRPAFEELWAPRAATVEEVLADLDDPAGWVFTGDGAGLAADRIRSAGGRVTDPESWAPRASALLWLASTDPDAGRVRSPATWEPTYVRAPGAERNRVD
jgi:tRNA threonylcarbamoyladenosine biosynthesis protein TsaB